MSKRKQKVESGKLKSRKRKSRAKPKGNNMANKKETAEQEAEEQAFLGKQVKEPLHHPKKNAGGTPAATADGSEQYAGEEFLPPPDPPAVDSPPRPPATGYEVDHQQKGAQPEATATREMELLQVGTRGEGPAPEPPEEAPPPEGK
jgi:hypothetical protein